MATLGQIETWHTVKDAQKVADLVAAYKSGADIPPVIVLHAEGNYPVAISGVHRIAALREIHGEGTRIEDLGREISVYDPNDLCAGSSEDVRESVDRCFPPRGDAGDVARVLAEILADERDAEALRGQI